jgi:hypothetical protein
VRDHQKAEVTQVELFLNQVKLLVNLSQDEKMRLLDALEEVTYTPGTPVIKQVPSSVPHPLRPGLSPSCRRCIVYHLDLLQLLRGLSSAAEHCRCVCVCVCASTLVSESSR